MSGVIEDKDFLTNSHIKNQKFLQTEQKYKYCNGDKIDNHGKVVAASILCFAVCDKGNLYFLLGKESSHFQYSNKADHWSDFGGMASKNDEDAYKTAAREYIEESMGVLNDVESMEHDLRLGNYVCALSIGMSSQTRHICFLKQVKWMPEAPTIFLQMRKHFMRIRNTSKKISWMLRRKPDGQRLHLIDWVIHRNVTNKGDMAIFVKCLCNESDANVIVQVRYKMLSGRTYLQNVIMLEGHTVVDLMRYQQYLDQVLLMEKQYDDMPVNWRSHPALSYTYWRGRLVRIVVSRHYLEMQCLRWWSLPYLHELLQCNGKFQKNIIRPCFIPTLRLMLDYLAIKYNTHDAILTLENK